MRWLLLFLLLALPAQAQVEAEAAPRKIKIGQSVKLTIEIPANLLTKPPAADSLELKGWEVRDAVLVSLPGDAHRYTLQLTCWEPGKQTIPSLKLGSATTPEIAIEVLGAEPEPKDDIRDFKGLAPYQVPTWVYAALVSLSLALLAALIYAAKAVARRLRAKPAPPLTPREWALGELDRLPAQQLPAREYYSRLSEIVRAFLARRFQVPVLERTTAELLQELPPSESLKEVLEQADMVKFAGQAPPPETAAAHLRKAREFVEGQGQ